MAKKKGVKVSVGSTDWSAIKTMLKTGTYFLLGTIASYIMMAIQGGASLQDALATGVALGIIAGIKNFMKHQFNIDLDLTKLKK